MTVSSGMCGRALTLVVLLAAPFSQTPAHSANPEQSATVVGKSSASDIYGDPLPEGALTRLGTTRFRHAGSAVMGGGAEHVLFTRDGQGIFTLGLGNPPRLWDATTGKLQRTFSAVVRDTNVTPSLMERIVPNKKRLLQSKDGSTLVIPSSGKLQVWNTKTAALVGERDFAGTAYAISADGQTLTLAEQDGTGIKIVTWEVATGKTEQLPSIAANTHNLALSPDAKTLVSADNSDQVNNYVRFWDVAAGKERHQTEFDLFNNWQSTFSPDGRFVAMTGLDSLLPGGQVDGIVHVWDVIEGKEVAQIGEDKMGTFSVAFSPDNQILATGSGAGPIRLWDWKTGTMLRECQGNRSHTASLAFSPNGKQLVSGASFVDNMARVWDVETGQEVVLAAQGHYGPILTLAYRNGGQELVSGGRDGLFGVWDCQSGRLRQPLSRAGELEALAAVSRDGNTIVTVASTYVPYGKRAAYTPPKFPSTIRVWDAQSGKQLRHFPGPTGVPVALTITGDGPVGTLIFSQSFKNRNTPGVAYGLEAKQVPFRFDCAAETIELLKKPSEAQIVRCSTDGKFLAAHHIKKSSPSKIDSNLISLWEASSDSQRGEAPGPADSYLSYIVADNYQAISPDGRWVATAGVFPAPAPNNPENAAAAPEKFSIRLWNPSAPTENAITIEDFQGRITALEFSPDGSRLAGACTDGTLRIWETATGKEWGRFSGYDGEIWAITFSPDGKTLATGANDSTILIWDLASLNNKE